jgi:hypothetical protein
MKHVARLSTRLFSMFGPLGRMRRPELAALVGALTAAALGTEADPDSRSRPWFPETVGRLTPRGPRCYDTLMDEHRPSTPQASRCARASMRPLGPDATRYTDRLRSKRVKVALQTDTASSRASASTVPRTERSSRPHGGRGEQCRLDPGPLGRRAGAAPPIRIGPRPVHQTRGRHHEDIHSDRREPGRGTPVLRLAADAAVSRGADAHRPGKHEKGRSWFRSHDPDAGLHSNPVSGCRNDPESLLRRPEARRGDRARARHRTRIRGSHARGAGRGAA